MTLGDIVTLKLADITPSPDNGMIYKAFSLENADDLELARDIYQHGIVEPIVITADNVILSGHRRHAAAIAAGLNAVPVRYVEAAYRDTDADKWLCMLRQYNQQREKSLDEILREEVVTADPETAHRELVEHRRTKNATPTTGFNVRGNSKRAAISKAKKPFLDAVQLVIEARREYWPLSVRQIHYALLNNPPLMHASKPHSVYTNTKEAYHNLDNLVTRGRLAGLIPWEALADETRPVTLYDTHSTAQGYLKTQLNKFMTGYWRDLMQSQPHHIEIIVEKNTVAGIVRRVAREFTIPMTSGRGYCSLPPRYDIARRYRESGKMNLVLILLSDHDPDGDEIIHSFCRSMRDDFGIENITPIKAAITPEQIEQFGLPGCMNAQHKKSSNCAKFVTKYGADVYELEALPPEQLEEIVRTAILDVIDMDAFQAEQRAEIEDAGFISEARQRALAALKSQG